ncbi:hypothetical protein GGP86_000259 [Salinibacter ruber]|uniref:hypothetical protein n=1 Tax=Salinibacter ruber TaxID=146919 RepID=UPI0021690919|nr:hypothetical protein [Salinibacter ruber]MCS3860511.1 hypothetical protein [Salinibacter ruber]
MPPPSSTATVMDAAFKAGALETLLLDVPEAHLRLQPHDEADRIQVRGAVPGADADTARRLFDRKEISTHQSGDRLHVFGRRVSEGISDWRKRLSRPTAVRLDVFLPPSLDVTAHAFGGTVESSDLAGSVDLTAPGGSVCATGLTGPLRVRGSGGDLTVQHSTDAALTAQWAAGTVRLERLQNTSVTLQARSSPTTVEDLNGSADLSVHGAALTLQHLTGPCKAQVRGGALTYRGAPTENTILRAVGGALHTHLPHDHAAGLLLTGAQVALDDDFAFEGQHTAHRIEGRLNGGGVAFEGRAVQGAAQCRALSGA